MTTAETRVCAKGILLVEDDPNDVLLMLRAFQKIDLRDQVAVVGDGGEALDYLFGTGEFAAAPPELPKLVLLDLHMPRVNGLEVLDRIRTDARTRFLPVVAFTSSSAERDLVGSYLGGANSCVRKPEKFAEFAGVLRQIWLYWSAINEPAPVPQASEAESAIA